MKKLLQADFFKKIYKMHYAIIQVFTLQIKILETLAIKDLVAASIISFKNTNRSTKLIQIIRNNIKYI